MYKSNIMDGVTYYYQYFTLKIGVVDCREFEALLTLATSSMSTSNTGIFMSHVELGDDYLEFLWKLCEKAREVLITKFNPVSIRNKFSGETKIRVIGVPIHFKFEFKALPKFASGNGNQTAIDIYRSKIGEPMIHFLPVFEVNIVVC